MNGCGLRSPNEKLLFVGKLHYGKGECRQILQYSIEVERDLERPVKFLEFVVG